MISLSVEGPGKLNFSKRTLLEAITPHLFAREKERETGQLMAEGQEELEGTNSVWRARRRRRSRALSSSNSPVKRAVSGAACVRLESEVGLSAIHDGFCDIFSLAEGE